MYVLSIVGTVIGTAFRPAQAALVPNLARSPEELTAANVTATTIESVGIFVGPALGGVLVATTSVSVTFLVAAALLLWSAILVGLVREPARESTDEPEEAGGFLRESVAGFRVIVADRRLRVLTGLFAVQTFVDGALGVLVVVLALETLDLGASGVGLLNSSLGIGGIVGGVAAAMLVARSKLGTDLGVGSAALGRAASRSSACGPRPGSPSPPSRSSASATRSWTSRETRCCSAPCPTPCSHGRSRRWRA